MRCARVMTWCGLIGLAIAWAAEAGQPARPTEDFFPVSVWYSGGKARAPMLSTLTDASADEWRRDLERIRSLGFNAVRTWVEWAHCEPREGEFHFENLKLLCRLAQEANLRVIVQVYADSAPDWVGRKHPDAMFEAQSGEKVPSQAAPGYCTDKPEVGRLVARFYTEAARAANAFSSMYAWDLWSEPHIINWAVITYVPNAQFCFCPHTRARFQEWLGRKYGSVEALNKAWYRGFERIHEADPPRFGTILSYTDFIDWKSFIYDKLAGDLRMRAEAIRAAGGRHVTTSHAAVPSLFTSPFSGDGASDDFLMAEQVDYYGTSIYPKHSFPSRHWPRWQVNVAMDFSRSANLANGGFYVGELQAGYGTRGVVVSDPVTEQDLRLWMWSIVARGGRAINIYAYYPMSSGYESGGYGLVELDGMVTRRAEEAGRIARLIDENRAVLLGTRPERAQVAIVYNPLSQMVGGEQSSGPEGGARDSLIGYYRAFAESNIPVDFIHRRMVERGVSDQYRVVIVPYPLMWTQAAADGLRAFVEKGGTVLAEARMAWNDDRGFASPVIPGMGLSEVFGVRETRVSMADEVLMRSTPAAHEMLGQVPDLLKGAYFAESFEPLERARASVLAVHGDDTPAIVLSPFGKGRAIAAGSFLGMAAHRGSLTPNTSSPTSALIRSIARVAGVSPRVTVAGNPGGVEARLLEGEGRAVLVVINTGSTPQRVQATVRVDWNATARVRDMITGKASETAVREGQVRIDLELPGRDVRAVVLTPQ